MEPTSGRGRLGGFQQFQSSLSHLIRATEANLQQGVFGTTDALAPAQPGPSLGLATGLGSLAPQVEEEKETMEGQFHSIAPRRSPAAGRACPPHSPPLSTLDGLLDPPPIPVMPASTPYAAPPTHYAAPPYASGTVAAGSAMSALQSHFTTQDTLAAVRAQARESAEAVTLLHGTLQSFKAKMRSAFDVNMATLDRKVRLMRKDILHHISDTTAELEKRMVDHLQHGLAKPAEADATAESEFRRNTQEELLYLKSELSKQHFAASERVADLERTRRARDHAFTAVQTRVDEHHSLLQDMQAAVYATEKDNLLLRAEMEQLKTKLRREVGHAQTDSQNKFVELAKGMAEMKKTMEAMVRREQEAEMDRTEAHAQLAAHINSAAQTYIDEQLFTHAAAVKTIKRAQLLQADEIERVKKDVATRARREGPEGDGDDASFVAKAFANMSARLDGLERDLKLDRSLAGERAKEVEAVKCAASVSEQEARELMASHSRSLREDLARLEKDALAREQHARTWREELNTWSRNLEQTMMNLKYSLQSGAALSQSTAGLAASQGVGLAAIGAHGAPKDFAPYLEHPSNSPLSQALVALEQRTTSKFALLEAELSARASLPSPANDQPDQHLQQLEVTVAQLQAAVAKQAAETAAQVNDVLQAHKAAERERAAEASKHFAVPAAPAEPPASTTNATFVFEVLDARLSARMDLLDSSLKDEAAATESRFASLETRVTREADELRVLQLEVKRQATLQNYQHQLHVASTSGPSAAATASSTIPPPLPSPKLVLPRTVAAPATVTVPATATAPVPAPASYTAATTAALATSPAPQQPSTAATSSSSSTSAASPVATPNPPPTTQTRVERVPDTPVAQSRSSTLAAASVAAAATTAATAKTGTLASGQPEQRLRAFSQEPEPLFEAKGAAAEEAATTAVTSAANQPAQASTAPQLKWTATPTLSSTAAAAAPAPTPAPASTTAAISTATPSAVPASAPSPKPVSVVAKPAAPAPPSPPRGPPAHFSFDHSPDPAEDASEAPTTPVPFLIRKTSTPKQKAGSFGSPLGAAAASLRRANSGGGSAMSPLSLARSGLKNLPLPPPSAAINQAAPTAASPSPAPAPEPACAPEPAPAPTPAPTPAAAAVVAKPLEDASEEESSSSEDESSGEDIGYSGGSSFKAPAAVPPNASASAMVTRIPLQRVPDSPVAAGGNVDDLDASAIAGESGDSLDDDDEHTGGVAHSVLSAAVKQRYLDAEAAGQVDGEGELDEDSLYDPEDHPDEHRPVSERARQIAAAIAANAAHRRGYDHSEQVEDDDDDLDLDVTAPAHDQSLNTKFRTLQADAKQQARDQYAAVHARLQAGGNQQWTSEDEEEEDESGDLDSPVRPPHAAAASSVAHHGAAFARAPLSNPGVSELSPLGKPLKSSLGSLKPGQLGLSASNTPAFMKPPLGSPKHSALAAPKPFPQPLPSRAPAANFGAGATRRVATAAAADEFDEDDSVGDDLMSSLSVDYRRLGAAPSHAAGGSHPSSSEFDDDLSSPRVDDFRSPAGIGGVPLRRAVPHSASPAYMHGEVDEDEMGSLFDPTGGHGQRQRGEGGDASFVSELDQMELSASHDAFNTDF